MHRLSIYFQILLKIPGIGRWEIWLNAFFKIELLCENIRHSYWHFMRNWASITWHKWYQSDECLIDFFLECLFSTMSIFMRQNQTHALCMEYDCIMTSEAEFSSMFLFKSRSWLRWTDSISTSAKLLMILVNW